jgi:hypothetical protein
MARIDQCKEQPRVFVVLDEAAPPESCAGCGGSFKRWGYARARLVREQGAARRLERPRRIRCRGCLITHVLLSGLLVPRRADTAPVILSALLAKAGGRGHRAIAAELTLPPATVRGWLRRASANAERARGDAMRLAVVLDPLLGPCEPAGSALGDALNAIGVTVRAARLRLGPIGPPTAMAMIIGEQLLHPLRT